MNIKGRYMCSGGCRFVGHSQKLDMPIVVSSARTYVIMA